jgi:type II secretory pathway pseudopilin PulG
MIFVVWAKHQRVHQKQHGFSYVEVLVAMFILTITIMPAMEGIQSGIQGAGIHESLTRQHYALIKRMEEVQADSYLNMLAAAQTATNATTPSSYSDPSGQADRILVFLALYDTDANPLILVDPNNDSDGDIYTGDSSNLLWLRVELENSALHLETLISR